jgi:predicted nucleic acid-binding protein
MKIDQAFDSVNRIFLDTAPVIYYVEQNPHYSAIANRIFDDLIEENETLLAVASPITLAECLILPLRQEQAELQQDFFELLTMSPNILFENINDNTGFNAAKFRNQYNLKLPDALQIAVALQANCDALLTNDLVLKRVTESPIIVLSELEL